MRTGSLSSGYSATTAALTSITHSAGSSLAFAYDGLVPMSVTWSGPVAGTVPVGYDGLFRVDTIWVNGSPIAFAHDNDGLLNVKEGGAVVRSYGYDANGNRLSLSGPGLSATRTYEAQGTAQLGGSSR